MSSIYKRGKYWQIKFSFQRKSFQYSLRTKNKSRASVLQKKIDAFLDVGLFPNLDEIIYDSPLNHDLLAYLDHLEAEIDGNYSWAESYRRRQKVFIKHFRNFLRKEKIRFFTQVNINVAAKYRNWRLNTFSDKTKENIAPKTIREELMFIKNKIFERAIEEKIISENPFRRAMKDLRVYKKEVLPFTEEEVNLLIQNAPNDLHQDFYTVLYLTGSRFGEIANLEWDDIDFENKLLFIRNKSFHKTKTRSERVIPLHPRLEKIFQNRKQKIKSKFVFPSPKDDLKPVRTLQRKFTDTKLKLNIDPRKTLHSFRHAFATHLRRKGVSLETIQELLGHTDIKMTRHYQHRDLKVLKEAISKLQILSG